MDAAKVVHRVRSGFHARPFLHVRPLLLLAFFMAVDVDEVVVSAVCSHRQRRLFANSLERYYCCSSRSAIDVGSLTPHPANDDQANMMILRWDADIVMDSYFFPHVGAVFQKTLQLVSSSPTYTVIHRP